MIARVTIDQTAIRLGKLHRIAIARSVHRQDIDPGLQRPTIKFGGLRRLSTQRLYRGGEPNELLKRTFPGSLTGDKSLFVGRVLAEVIEGAAHRRTGGIEGAEQGEQ